MWKFRQLLTSGCALLNVTMTVELSNFNPSCLPTLHADAAVAASSARWRVGTAYRAARFRHSLDLWLRTFERWRLLQSIHRPGTPLTPG